MNKLCLDYEEPAVYLINLIHGASLVEYLNFVRAAAQCYI